MTRYTTLYNDSFFKTPITQYYYCHYVVLSNDSIVWSGLDMWSTGGGCVGQLTLVAVNRVSVSSHSLECLSRTFSNTVPVS